MKTTTIYISTILLFFINAFSLQATINNESEFSLKSTNVSKAYNDMGAISLHTGYYLIGENAGTLTLNYESPDLLKRKEKVDITITFATGFTIGEAYANSSGRTSSLYGSILLGNSIHKFKFDLGYAQFVERKKALFKGHSDFLPHTFIGYRYYGQNSRLFLTGGVGLPELIQFTVGYKL